jgi:glycosyltransferase involved in cell wall biosynthesis
LVHLISGLAAGGTESFLLRLLAASAELRQVSRIISVRRKDDLSSSFRQLGVPVDFYPLEFGPRGLLNLMRLARALSAREVRLVQSWLYLSDAMAAILARALFRKPVVWGIRSSHGGEGKRATRFIARRLNPWLSSRFVDAIAVCGTSARTAHEGFGYDARKMVVIPNGFDLGRLVRDESAGAGVRRALGLGAAHFLVGMVARAEIYKDHATLFKAVASLRESMPGLRIVLCGNGMDESNADLTDLMTQCGVRDIVHLMGLRRDLPAIYSALDLHVLSSHSEGFPNVVAEAMLCGCGSISTDVGEAAEIIQDRRWIVPVASVAELARAIAAFHALGPSERAALIERNDAGVRRRFSIDQTARTYMALYRSLATMDAEASA